MNPPPLKVGYVVKRYPRFSETFVVNEILAHEAAGRSVEIISLYPPNDTHFQDNLARVRAPVSYLLADGLRAADFWKTLERFGDLQPEFWSGLAEARGSEAREIYQAALLARFALDRGIRHLHAHFASTATEVTRLAARFARIPYSFTCDLIGTGELEAKLRQQIVRHRLQRVVRIVGALPQSEVIASVRSAAAFAAPCVVGSDGNADGLPTVLLEAMALGTPCVSTDVTGIPEIIRHGETGLVVAQNDPGELASALKQLLTQPTLRTELATRARLLIEAEFDTHRNAAAIWKLFESATRSASGLNTGSQALIGFQTSPSGKSL